MTTAISNDPTEDILDLAAEHLEEDHPVWSCVAIANDLKQIITAPPEPAELREACRSLEYAVEILDEYTEQMPDHDTAQLLCRELEWAIERGTIHNLGNADQLIESARRAGAMLARTCLEAQGLA